MLLIRLFRHELPIYFTQKFSQVTEYGFEVKKTKRLFAGLHLGIQKKQFVQLPKRCRFASSVIITLALEPRYNVP